METFILSATQKTPDINFNGFNGEFSISGRSIPENSIEYFKPVLNWLDAFVKLGGRDVRLKIKLEYFNTSSSKCLVEVFRKLEDLKSNGKHVVISWYYEAEDEDMMESGQDFQQIIKVPIELVPFENEE